MSKEHSSLDFFPEKSTVAASIFPCKWLTTYSHKVKNLISWQVLSEEEWGFLENVKKMKRGGGGNFY